MDAAEKYEMIGNHIYRYGRVKLHLAFLLNAMTPDAGKEIMDAEADILIPRITAELSNRGAEIRRQFSEVAVQISALKNERDLSLKPGHPPDGQATTNFLNQCTDVLAKLATIKAAITNSGGQCRHSDTN
jgi:hypothetical protein